MTTKDLEQQARHVEVLRMVIDGRITGRISEWPQLKPAIEHAIAALTSAQGNAGHRARELQFPGFPEGRLFAHGEMVYSQKQMREFAADTFAMNTNLTSVQDNAKGEAKVRGQWVIGEDGSRAPRPDWRYWYERTLWWTAKAKEFGYDPDRGVLQASDLNNPAPTEGEGEAVRKALDYLHPFLDQHPLAAPDWAIQLASILTGGDGCGYISNTHPASRKDRD